MDDNGHKLKCSIVYDFDGTLAEGDCMQHGLMQAIGIDDPSKFWNEVQQEATERDGNGILAYMGMLALYAKNSCERAELSSISLQKHGATIPLFPGVVDWFDAVNAFATDHNLELAHYIVSSGLEEMIAGTPIAKHFKKIFACRYHYDSETGNVKWPCVAIDYTAKTQYLFRINKGIENTWDNKAVNEFVSPENRPYPFSRMIYLGDGDTDIPSMKLVKMQGGCSIAVFDPKKWPIPATSAKIEKLISEDRVAYVAPGDYRTGSQLDVTVKGVLKKFARRQ